MVKRNLILLGHLWRTHPDDLLRRVLLEYTYYTPHMERWRPGTPRTSWLLQSCKDDQSGFWIWRSQWRVWLQQSRAPTFCNHKGARLSSVFWLMIKAILMIVSANVLAKQRSRHRTLSPNHILTTVMMIVSYWLAYLFLKCLLVGLFVP